MAAESNKALARRLVDDILNNWDPDLVDEAFAEDLVNHQGAAGPTGGREELKQVMGVMFAAFPDLHFEIEHMIAEDDLVALHLTARGTHEGEFAGIAPTGKPIVISGLGMIRIADGKVVERWNVQDAAGLMAQLTS